MGFRAWLRNELDPEEKTLDAYAADAHALADRVPLATMTMNELFQAVDSFGGSDSSRQRRYHALSHLGRYLVEAGLRTDNPMLALLRPKEKRPTKAFQPIPGVARKLQVLRRKDEKAFLAALMILHTHLRAAELISIDETPPIGEWAYVVGRKQARRAVRLSEDAQTILAALGGGVGMSIGLLQRRLRSAGLSVERLRVTPLDRATILLTPFVSEPLAATPYAETIIEAYRDEAWGSLDAGSHRAAMVLARAALQAACRRYLPRRDWGMFGMEMKQLALIAGQGWQKVGGTVKDFGNEWAHPDPTRSDLMPGPTETQVSNALRRMDTVLRMTAEMERVGYLQAINRPATSTQP